ncbi:MULTISPECIES: histidine phosphatase family protein [Falsihalocynthiibacter]|uniref:histidine phosphatase family protein n=1 Tax=Falsihalocynthiibacter TaxID=2854182 RepID=UPI0030013CE3
MTVEQQYFMAIYFIRHGQSEFNATFKGIDDPMIFDAPLTKFGLAQAKTARDKASRLGITRVITSPFTRAIQTAQTIFGGISPIEVQHGHHELLLHSCDIGRHPHELKVDFPNLSFDHLPRSWWYENNNSVLDIVKEPIESFQKRISRFVADLNKIDNETIAIVGHGNAFKEIIGFALNNCQIHQFR